MPKKEKKPAKNKEKQGKTAKKQEDKPKKQGKTVIDIRPKRIEKEPEVIEFPDETDEHEPPLYPTPRHARQGAEIIEEDGDGLTPPEQPTQILDNDDYDTIYNIKESLIQAGVPIQAEKKFIVSKKENGNKYSFQKTYYNDMPDMSEVGQELRGGDFMVSVHAEIKGKKQIVKNYYFTISTEQYPPLPKNPAGQPVSQPAPAQDSLLVEVMRQSNERFEKLLEQLSNGSSMKEMVETMVAMKGLFPSNEQQKIPYNEMFKMQGDMFKAGLEYANNIAENSDKENLGDVLLGMVKDVTEKINWGALTGTRLNPNPANALPQGAPIPPIKPAGQPAGAPPQASQGSQAQALAVLNDFFMDIIVAFDSELEVNPYIFAEKVKKIAKYKIIDNFVLKLEDDKIFAVLSSGGLKERLDNPEFFQYVKSIIDIIRKFDIIELDDDGEIIYKEVKPETPAVAQVKDNDNSRQPVTTGDDGKPAPKPAGENVKV